MLVGRMFFVFGMEVYTISSSTMYFIHFLNLLVLFC